jgi:hypothetical protein
MSVFPNSPPRNADIHHRWSAAGYGRARTTATRSGDLVLPVSMDAAKLLTRNTHQRQCLILHPVQSPRAHRQILRRAALKSP